MSIEHQFAAIKTELEAGRRFHEKLLERIGELVAQVDRLVEQERLLVGWPTIAFAAGLGISQAKAEGGAQADPLPYFLEGGRAMAWATAVAAWRQRRRVHTRRRARTISDQRRGKR